MNLNTITYTFPLEYLGTVHIGTMHYNSRVFDEETKFQSEPSQEFLGLFFNLNNEIKYQIKGASQYTLGRNQFNLLYLPKACCEFIFKKGSHASFCVDLPLSYMRLIAENFPKINNFLDEIKEKIPIALSEEYLTISPEIRDKIHSVLYNKFPGEVVDDYLRGKFVEITILSLEHRQRNTYPGFNEAEVEKIRQAYARIINDIQAPHNVSLIADELDISQRKLERGFRILFHTTVYNFLVEERMKRAISLLRDTTMPVREVAVLVGYPNARAFSNLFRKRFGYSPSLMRKRR